MSRRRLISVLIAVLGSVVGLPLLWAGSAQVLAVSQRFTGGGQGALSVPGGLAMLLVGVLLCGVVGVGVAWSSLGAVVVGAIHVVVGMLALLLPINIVGGGPTPVWDVVFSLADVDQNLSDGASIFTARGIGLILGFALIGGGLAVRWRRRRSGAVLSAATTVATAAGAIVSIVFVVLALMQGERVFRQYFVFFDPDISLALVLGLLAVGVGVGAVSLAWSPLGVGIAGGLLLVGGTALALVAPRSVALLSGEQLIDVLALATLALPQAVGALLLGLGLAGRRVPATIAH